MPISKCYRCHTATLQFQVCDTCRIAVGLNHVWVISDFDEKSKQIIHQFKFQRCSYVARFIAIQMKSILPVLDDEVIICHVPTAPSRIRVRGYDQSRLIAIELSKITNLKYKNLISRISKDRQLGAVRANRIIQANRSYSISKPSTVKDKRILLVDDVTTSGATIEAIANLLKKYEARSVDAIVYAQAID